jgi:hypothetical protein
MSLHCYSGLDCLMRVVFFVRSLGSERIIPSKFKQPNRCLAAQAYSEFALFRSVALQY